MKEMFLSLELSKKLKEKGFTCKYPFAMYNEPRKFHALFTSADKYTCEPGRGYREYYGYDDFDEKDVIAPTIEQVLTWLRKEKELHIVCPFYKGEEEGFFFYVHDFNLGEKSYPIGDSACLVESYETAAVAAIEYVLDNLI